MTFRIDDYLTRIGLSQPESTAAGLAQLQQAQLNAIAFENIDPLLGILPNLEMSAMVEKVLKQGRGGYCFELNGLLASALDELGFNYQPIMARVRMGRSEGGPRHHLAFIVEADGESWLVDAGFGGPAARFPLLLNSQQEQQQAHDIYRIRYEAASGENVLEQYQPDGWFALYSFDRAAVRRCDMDAANMLCATWEQSLLARNLLLCRYTEFGRIQLFNSNFSEFRAGAQHSLTIETVEQLNTLVRNDFGIAVTDSKLTYIAKHLGLA
ncbi:arylamine N-acetyltransferase family protein [Methylomonas methanica]|uniref:N-hydroxyarylamine O-acetyltransferase n=1 Tax=Methylomonas methanica (strain DSM 25384 / MC09) TaxID=857087 RepID=G0A608_METMM|nr:arylamine N-acetyltransferase [Methylomonas methanica]AEG00458.1 N-hydroxyarylamine O-acetyltransferase [Methylomonas methanica MC09]